MRIVTAFFEYALHLVHYVGAHQRSVGSQMTSFVSHSVIVDTLVIFMLFRQSRTDICLKGIKIELDALAPSLIFSQIDFLQDFFLGSNFLH
jgi:hypothetical protein